MTELQQLLPYYLNSGVKVKTKHGEICTLTSIGRDYILLEYKNNSYLSALSHSFSVIKLLCHPLSDYKDINSPAMNDLNIDVEDQIVLSDFANKKISRHFISFGVIQICLQNHIWIGSDEGYKNYCEEIK